MTVLVIQMFRDFQQQRMCRLMSNINLCTIFLSPRLPVVRKHAMMMASSRKEEQDLKKVSFMRIEKSPFSR
jgi:hypothetical protein